MDEVGSGPHRVLTPREQALALSAIEKSQQMTGHFPTREDLDRARRVLDGSITLEQAFEELDANFSN